ncbi:MAG: gp436 family protein [Terriglobales bacterium]
MQYAAQSDLSPRRLTAKELIELTDDSGSGQVDAATVSDVLTEASATVDSYAAQRYQVPLQLSEQVKGMTLDIAVYKLFQRRRRVAEDVRRAYEDALAFLKLVAEGKAALDQPAGIPAQQSGGPAVATEKEEKFTDEHLDGYVQ